MTPPSSALDFFTIGLGPSCDHSVLPMLAASRFGEQLVHQGHAAKVRRVKACLGGRFASSPRVSHARAALLLGLQGASPESLDLDAIQAHLAGIRSMKSLRLPWGRVVTFDESIDVSCQADAEDGIRLMALDESGTELLSTVETGTTNLDSASVRRFPFQTGSELARLSRESGYDISTLMLRHEAHIRAEAATREALRLVWQTMKQSVLRGCSREPEIDRPAGSYRAAMLHRELTASPLTGLSDPLTALDWVGLWAIAVSEENAAGGRVVAVPTNETCGILPAVLHYLVRVHGGGEEERVLRFLLTASAISVIGGAAASAAGIETSLACAMASAAICEALGGNAGQVLTAAALGMESHRGTRFTSAEFPAIGEPNAIAAVTAIHTARLALRTPQPDAGLLDRVISHLHAAGARSTAKSRSLPHPLATSSI